MKYESKNEFCSKIYNAIGVMPLVRLGWLKANEDADAQVPRKCQFFNSLSSVMDRDWLAMIEATKPDNGIQGTGVGFVSKIFNPDLISEVLPIGLRNRPSRGTAQQQRGVGGGHVAAAARHGVVLTLALVCGHAPSQEPLFEGFTTTVPCQEQEHVWLAEQEQEA
mgnify:CR=1 FL=1